MTRIVPLTFVTVAVLSLGSLSAVAEEMPQSGVYTIPEVKPARKRLWWGDWYLKVGAASVLAPAYNGSNNYKFSAQPLVSFGHQGEVERFSSRNDNVSFAIIDTDCFRAGATGKLLFKRDTNIDGIHTTRFGGEAGGFVDVYPADWLRFRGEARQGIRAHKGFVVDIAADAFHDVAPRIRVSAGPRATFATKDYFKTFYGVAPEEAVASGVKEYRPEGGWESVGMGGAVAWKATSKIDTSLFGEYSRLEGPAKDSSFVKQHGSRDQFMFGVAATYHFDFSIE
ncbi:MipA/OmpV family protein [Brucella intermedia]|uniref:MipA/OmpV family protein n=1 Tax=Brucella intermedia TaxID=94625 RepID=UPI002360FB43|nr:MipA/OmpV family protein [Brucella intermedia]